MNRKTILLIGVILSFLTIQILPVKAYGLNFKGKSTHTVKLEPIADTYVDGKYHLENRGSSSLLSVWAYGDRYISFLKFDLTNISSNAEIVSAELFLRVYEASVDSNEASIIGVHQYSDNSWGEYGLTWDTADWGSLNPIPIDTTEVFIDKLQWQVWFDWNVIYDVETSLGNQLSLVLMAENHTESIFFCSRETSFKPYLRITYTVDEMVCLLVDSSIYGSLQPWINVYLTDVEETGMKTTCIIIENESAQEIRGLIKGIPNLIGCLLVGEIPAAWYEMDVSFGHLELPTDLYYLDLDGQWADEDSDGFFDKHTGDVDPEIWVGRLKPPASSIGDQVNLLRMYFRKNHIYRLGGSSLPYRALVYLDRADFIPTSFHGIEDVYQDHTIIVDPITEPNDYLRRVTEGWNFVYLCGHVHHMNTFVLGGQC